MELKEALAEIEKLKEQSDIATAAATKANGESKDRRLEAKELKEKLAAFDGIDVDEFKNVKAQAAQLEQDRLKQEGLFDEALKKGLSTLEAENIALKDLVSGKDGKLSKVLIDNAILSAIDGKAINNEQALKLMRDNVKMDGDDPVVMSGDAPMLDEKGVKLSVSDYAKKWLDDNPHHVVASGGGSGSQGNSGNNSQGGKTITRDAFDNMNAGERAAHFKDGGIVKD